MIPQVQIFGSCVSRDILNYQNNKIALTDYFARSSIASVFASLSINDTYTKNLDSDFQWKVVAADLGKKFKEYIKIANFDLLLIDFIDERFNLFMFDHGGFCTLSNELLSAGFNPEEESGRIIPSGSDEFFALWGSGWVRFLSEINRTQCRDKIRINKVFWATTTSSGREFPTYSKNYILSSNKFLDRLYARVAKDLGSWQFIEASASHFVAAEDHRWGLSPFHYINAYYIEALSQLLFFLRVKRS